MKVLQNNPDVLRFYPEQVRVQQIRGEAEEVKLGDECESIRQRTLKIE